MSLELEIKNLIDVIKILNETLKNQTTSVKIDQVCNEMVEETLEEIKREEVKTYTHTSVKELILELNREDPKRKTKLKALLESYGATKVSDIKQEDLQALMGKLEAGDY